MKAKNIWNILFIFYICLLLYFVVIKFDGALERISYIQSNRDLGFYNYNLVPFRTLSYYIQYINDSFAYTNIFGNIIAFVPLGFLIPITLKKGRTFLKTILICFISIVGIEVFQLITMLGFFDIDDILLDTLGCFIGRCVFSGFQVFLNNKLIYKNNSST